MKRETCRAPVLPPPIRDPGAYALVQCAPVFSAAECERVVRLRGRTRWRPATVGSLRDGALLKGHVSGIRSARIVDIPFAPGTSWLFLRILETVARLNQRWCFDLSGILRPLHLVRYDPGDHYTWHVDAGPGELSDRKLSITVQLSGPDDYDGGDLELFGGPFPERAPRRRGTLVAFPSYVLHRVTQVRRGRRLSLVTWVQGPPFR